MTIAEALKAGYEKGSSEKLQEVKEVLALMLMNEVIDDFAYEQILIQIGT